MNISRNMTFWLIWLLLTLAAGGVMAAVMFVGGPRDWLLIGKTTSAHAQIEMACESCHTNGILDNLTKSPKTLAKDMTKACLSCHTDEKKISEDSHPPKKFRGAKAAKMRAALNAQVCSTCHLEHLPEITNANAVTLPIDFCAACHEKIGEQRESHADLGFETCASAGCHNFHDNTALYENFLVKHAGGEWIKEHAVHPFTAQARAVPAVVTAMEKDDPVAALKAYLDGKEVEDSGTEAIRKLELVLKVEDAIAPTQYMQDDAIAKWDGSAHALNGINCAGCHAPETEATAKLSELEKNWIEKPEATVCATCHKPQFDTFVEGKHGMRLHPEIAKLREVPESGILGLVGTLFKDKPLEPMTVGESVLAPKMKPSAHDQEINNCNACHKPHEVDLRVAAVESCVSCHNDTHTQNYFDSPHYALWQAELAGDAPTGSGVSCADCHMPKIEARGSFFTTHNQNAYFSPNEKMIRPVCMSCHSLEFSIDALADPNLVETNFNGRPEVHIESIDWALKREK